MNRVVGGLARRTATWLMGWLAIVVVMAGLARHKVVVVVGGDRSWQVDGGTSTGGGGLARAG